MLFAIGSERYLPYQKVKKPTELLTISNRILGFGQLSLAKYLFLTAEEDEPVSTHDEEAFIQYILKRIDLRRDLHFQTNTTIDTLDYSGTGLNSGSKVVFAAYGDEKRDLCKQVPQGMKQLEVIQDARLVMPGVVAIETTAFASYEEIQAEMKILTDALAEINLERCPLIVLCDDSAFVSESKENFLWATFTRSNPSHDIHGVGSFIEHKHWGCDAVIIDARLKGHHAPPLIEDEAVEARINHFFEEGGIFAPTATEVDEEQSL